ncbi:MAG: PQQ-dependent sugar dehydrogenase [Planctomycetales bacterium]|nr:PQQ-dependent sugar dehydrogenase [Planctomycetales bacterium]
MNSSTCPRLLAVLFGLSCLVTSGQADETLNQLTRAEQQGGWRLLFDGESTRGWRNYRKTGVQGWEAKSGELVRVAGGGDIVTDDEFQYFELTLEYRISKGGNSGIMFHVGEDAPAPWHTGPEIQVQDNRDAHDPQLAGWLYQLYKPVKPAWAVRFEKQVGFSSPEVVDATRPAGQWNQVYVRIAKQQCEVAVNGVSYYYFRMGDAEWNRRVAESKFAKFADFGKLGKGHLCLQDHGNEVAYRNIKIRVLPEDGSVPDPSDGELALEGREAFSDLKWAGWRGVDDGRVDRMRPMVLTHAGDGSKRIFVAMQRGPIHVFDSAKPQATKLFLDLSDRVHDWHKDDEEGLLGMAFHPKYAENGQLVVYYSSAAEPRTSIVSRFTVSKDDPNRADPASETVVMKIPQPFSNHNGGSIAFGHDGMLYIALGDGGGRNDPMGHGQNLETWMGSILRIDVDHRDGDRNYAIPKDNPFVGRKGAKPEIYAYGFRNIWRLSVDRKTGRLWLGDVGQDLWEEINVVRSGGNYGWSARESMHPFGSGDVTNSDSVVDPVWEYDHQVGKSITGGVVYRGSRLPELQGSYLYADYVSGKMWALEFDESTGKAKRNMRIATDRMPVLAFGEDEDGEVYYLLSTVHGRGIYRLERK